ncbi:hypothetical protein Scep_001834 [Stephania cephalantha]|uniref:Retrotransposon gag domain-containing protein n=1 Tax=Stephania cephalantha TaxID=152367 RepID=A0AAP0Q4D2_9MAGN
MATRAASDLSERVAHLEHMMASMTVPVDTTKSSRLEQRLEGLEMLVASLVAREESQEATIAMWETRFDELEVDVRSMGEHTTDVVEEIVMEVKLLKRPVGGSSEVVVAVKSRTKVPEPKKFSGKRSAKELENFLWDMEQYFATTGTEECQKVYLEGDAKLWWRTRVDNDVAAGRPKIAEWEVLKRKLKDQFLPTNAAWQAREALRQLKQKGTVREYVKEFSSLLLDIKNMSEEDKLFNFTVGLQGWAQSELRRQGVKDLQNAIAVADSLVDYKISGASFESKEKKYKEKDRADRSRKEEESSSKVDASAKASKGKRGCFICDGPHLAKDCPKREKLNAIVADEQEVRMNPLQLLNTMQVHKAGTSVGLMFVETQINNQTVKVLIDSGATHSMIAVNLALKLGLKLAESASMVKAVNSEPKKAAGVALDVDIRIDSWDGKVNLIVVPLDDFEIIAGNDFLVAGRVAVISSLHGLLIMDEKKPCFVPAMRGRGKGSAPRLVALQVREQMEVCCSDGQQSGGQAELERSMRASNNSAGGCLSHPNNVNRVGRVGQIR